MIDMIKNFIMNGWTTLMGLLKLEWLNFKNWKGWTSLRMLYFVIAVYMFSDMMFGLCGGSMWCMVYFAVCCFFKVEPIMWMLGKLGFGKTEI
jgi:hypothetical protein